MGASGIEWKGLQPAEGNTARRGAERHSSGFFNPYLGTNDYHGPCVSYLGDTGADGAQPVPFRVPPRTNFRILVSVRAKNVVYPSSW